MAQEIVNRFMAFSTSRSRIQAHIDLREIQPSGSLCKMNCAFFLLSLGLSFLTYAAPAFAIGLRKGHRGLNEPST